MTLKQEILEVIKCALEEIISDDAELYDNMDLYDNEFFLDSLDMVEIAMIIQEELDLEDEIWEKTEEINTVGELTDYLADIVSKRQQETK